MFRALKVGPAGKDASGQSLGDDWLVASCGYDDENGGDCYVTTNHLHGSDVPAGVAFAGITADLIARLLNEHFAGGCLVSAMPKIDPAELVNVTMTRAEADALHGGLVQALLGAEVTGYYGIRFYSGPDFDGVQVGYESDDRESPARVFGEQVMELIAGLVTAAEERAAGGAS